MVKIGEKAIAMMGKEEVDWSVRLAPSEKVVVIAENTWSAIKGKKALKAQWSDATPLENTKAHDKILTDLLDEKSSKIYVKMEM